MLFNDTKTPNSLQQTMKEQGWLRMKKIATDSKTAKLKSLATVFKLFNID